MDINIKYVDVKRSEFEDLVLACYSDGPEAGLLRTGAKGRWTLYVRRMLYEAEGLCKASKWFASVMDRNNIQQVVAGGFAAVPLIGGILSCGESYKSGAFVRESRKKYGFREAIEGSIDKDKEILVVDDIMNTGGACINVLQVMANEGVPMENVRVAVLVHFTHGKGDSKLKQVGIKHKLIKAMEITQK